jgi:hypothetical protein
MSTGAVSKIPDMPTPGAEIALAKRAISVGRLLFNRRKVLRNQRQDLLALYDEVTANLEAVRGMWRGDQFNRWAARSAILSTSTWQRLAYPLTNLIDGPVLERELATELDTLADEFERARHQTFVSSEWETRLVRIALAVRGLIEDHPRRRVDRLFLRRLPNGYLGAVDEEIVTPRSPAEMQKRILANLPRNEA